MFLLAIASKLTVWEKLQAVPMSTWLNLIVAILVIVMLVKIWKSLKELNEFAPWIVMVMIGGSVLIYWTYERTEPAFLSPAIDWLATYLPTKFQIKNAPGAN